MPLDTLKDNLWSVPDLSLLMVGSVRLVAAGALGAVLGLDRELTHKPAGLRTHMLVSMGTAVALIAAAAGGMSPADQSRVLQGVVAGIGFIGAGCIMRDGGNASHPGVRGLTTAASVWFTASIGAMCALAPLWLAGLATLLAWIVLVPLGIIERRLIGHGDRHRPPSIKE